MARDRNKRLIILIALIAVFSISIGFAAYSSSLLVKTHLSIDPNLDLFSVVFSSNASTLQTNPITPTKVPTDLEADDANINNTSLYPAISDLNVIFTKPGQSVTYTFYALNNGKFDAYLTSIVLENLQSGSFKRCVAGEGATQSSADSACDSIEVKVTAGSLEVTGTTLGIKDHILLQGGSEVVTITIKYKETGSVADGPVEVYFGNIYLTYGTQMTDEAPTLPSNAVCTLSNDVDSDGLADTGDEITCGSENFYVIPQDTINHPATTNTISMLAKYNLNVGYDTYPNEETYGIQDENVVGWHETKPTYGYTYFYDASTMYWTSDSYPAFVYNSNSDLYQYLEAYKTYLTSIGVNSAYATLISQSQLTTLGCSSSSCASAPTWVYSTTYWTGVASDNYELYVVYSDGYVVEDPGNNAASMDNGVRPVIIIDASELG